MARNGSGTFSLLGTLAPSGQVSNPTTINAIMDDIATALTDSVNANGTKAFAANQSFGGFKATSVAAATARTDGLNAGQVQDGLLNWIDGGGTADAITATYAPAITALVNGQICCVRATAANATTTPTFAPNGLTARTIVKHGGSALVAGDIAGDGHELILRYDLANARWELLNPVGVTSSAVITALLAQANSFTAVQTVAIDNAVTNAVTDILKLAHTSSGTAAASFGAGLLYQIEDAAGTLTDAASIDAVWTDATDASEDSKISFKTMVGGVAKAEKAFIGNGLVIGSATGGDQGAGTINATQIYRNGTAFPTIQWTTVFKAADETITSDATLSMDAALRFSAAANTNYVFEVEAWFTTATAADFKIGWDGPATPTSFRAVFESMEPDEFGTTLAGDRIRSTGVTAYETTGLAITSNTGTNGYVRVKGFLKNGANAANCGFTWSQGTSDAGNTTVLAGSYIRYSVVS